MTWLVYAQNRSGSIVWRNEYSNTEELAKDLEFLQKPSMFGKEEFRIVMQVI